MPDESELRDRMRDGDAGGALDAGRIIRRARMRRLPKQAAISVLGGLAVAAIVVPVAIGVGGTRTMSASDSAAGSAAAPESEKDATFAGSEAQDGAGTVCDPPVWGGEPAPSGVEVSAISQGEDVTLTLVNDGTQTLRGRVAGGPTLLLSSDDALAGWSAAATDPAPVDLAPGEQLILSVALEAVACDGGALTPGVYGLEVELPILTEDGTTVTATSRRTPIEVGTAQ
ncbi:hypothetical protein [Protaetiibacter mangrovi]|uniref:Uncharacterized protein n=1 Tax=Protaetiibacter mangrovi TaxID=2970926 RepID=A0ABT1ZIZ3_9MICO|nr:hypothetical protein [Protaetiibacter mangrovi]MCS0500674.1 hypothetical protein [Protaetiibacter mangrovi]